METILEWIAQQYIEVIATITGLIYIYFSIRQNILLWLFGIISSALAVYQCFEYKVYADMALNAYYVFISVYGWFYWKYGSKEMPEVKTSFTPKKALGRLLAANLLLWAALTLVLRQTDSDIPVLDSFTTATAIVGTWMLARKLIENWIFFIVADVISVGLYVYKELYFFAFLFLVYTILAFVGYKKWLKSMPTLHH